jgi:hypothetical protein
MSEKCTPKNKKRAREELAQESKTEEEETFVYVVYVESHYDCYKRASTTARIDAVFSCEEAAYEHCFLKQGRDLLEVLDDYPEKLETWKAYRDTLKHYTTWKEAWKHWDVVSFYPEAEFTPRPSGDFCFVKKLVLQKQKNTLPAITLPLDWL